MEKIKEEYEVVETLFFADFSNQKLANEIPRIRELTNGIIYTAPTGNGTHKKDFTDFIMLDYLYQSAIDDKDIDTYIIFTGDGHFSSVVNFLKNKQKKEVGIYAVNDALSTQLSNVASWIKTVPSEEEVLAPYTKALIEYLKQHSGQKQTKKAILQGANKSGRFNKNILEESLDNLVQEKYIDVRMAYTEKKGSVQAYIPNWEKIEESGIFVPQEKAQDTVTKLRKIISTK